MTIYGHLHLNWFFKELFAMTDKGIIYKGRQYEWDKIKDINTSFDFLFFRLPYLSCSGKYPGARIILHDGNEIRINARVFTRKGELPKFDATGFLTSKSKAFNDVYDMIKRKIELRATEQSARPDGE